MQINDVVVLDSSWKPHEGDFTGLVQKMPKAGSAVIVHVCQGHSEPDSYIAVGKESPDSPPKTFIKV